jgi:hypothetical protein
MSDPRMRLTLADMKQLLRPRSRALVLYDPRPLWLRIVWWQL